MSHPFGDLLAQHLHRKHGLSQAKLAAGILQTPSIISEMSQGKRLHGPQARARVTASITWLQQQDALTTLDEANALLNAAGMAPLQEHAADEARLIHNFAVPAGPLRGQVADVRATIKAASSSTLRHNLPAQLTPFIGRMEQIAQLVEQIQTHRLLTLTGAGGVGKTRLALEVAKAILDFRFVILDSVGAPSINPKSKIQNLKFPDGIWFVDLAPLTNPEAIPQRILDLWRVPEQPERAPLEALIVYLRTKETLLILDNCEHLIGACAALAEIMLQHCPQLSLLATSREALNIGGETPWRVPSLTRPHAGSGWDGQTSAQQPPLTPEALSRFEAVALFVERAGVRQPGFALTTIAHGEQHLQDVLFFAADQERALALLYLGFAATDRGDLTLGHAYLQESLAISQRCHDFAGMADVLQRFAEGSSNYPEACRQCAESLALWRQVGRPDRIARALNYLAWNTWCAGDYPLARAYWREGMARCEQLALPFEKAWLLDCIGNDAWVEDDMPFAEQCVREALAIYTEVGHQRGIAFCKAELGWVLTSIGQVEQAIALTQEAVAIARAVNSQMVLTLCLNYLGVAKMAAGDLVAARSALTEAIQRAWAHRYLYNLMTAFYYVAEWLVLESHTKHSPAALERQALAVTALSCVRTQAATWHFFKEKAAQLQAKIGEALPAEVYTTAIARGQSSTVEAMVNRLLAVVDTE